MSKNTTHALIRYFLKAYPGRSLIMIGCLLISGFIEGISISLFLPLIEIASNSDGTSGGTLGEAVRSLLAFLHIPMTIPVLLGLIVIGMSFKGAFRWLAMRQVGYSVAQVVTDMRHEMLGNLLRARWSYFTSKPVGNFAHTISLEAKMASTAYRNLAACMAGLVQVAIYTLIALIVSWQTALFALLAGALVMGILNRLIEVSRRSGLNRVSFMKALVARLTDALQGVKPIKAMARERHLLPLLEAEAQGLNEALRLKVLASETLTTFQEPLTILVMVVGFHLAHNYLDVRLAELMVLAFLFYRLTNQINLMVRSYQAITMNESAFWTLRETIDSAGAAVEHDPGTTIVQGLTSQIELRDVSFSYGRKPVLDRASLTIPAGKLVLLSGPSGSGKTTVADMIAGLHFPDTGDVLIDGVNLRDVKVTRWRRLVGYVPQELFLFNDTVRKNVSLGDPSISDAAVEGALKDVGAWSYVSSLSNGVDTVIGERGAELSGGQRQRIAIARALAGKPQLLILDEVTTALDPDSEAAVCKTLKDLSDRVTILAISHQQAMQGIADIIYRVDDEGIRKVKG